MTIFVDTVLLNGGLPNNISFVIYFVFLYSDLYSDLISDLHYNLIFWLRFHNLLLHDGKVFRLMKGLKVVFQLKMVYVWWYLESDWILFECNVFSGFWYGLYVLSNKFSVMSI